MSALTPDYDSDPGRASSFQLGWQEDVHGPVVKRLINEGVGRVLDVGSGIGRFASALGGRFKWVGIDESPRQLSDCPHRTVIRAHAARLPVADGSFDAVVLLWMLYHLDDPRLALAEARRVLRPGGLVAASASNRTNDPELVPQGYPSTTFDGEEAAQIVAEIFEASHTEVERWDAPLVHLRDRDEVAAYARSHLIPPQTVEEVEPPVTLAKTRLSGLGAASISPGLTDSGCRISVGPRVLADCHRCVAGLHPVPALWGTVDTRPPYDGLRAMIGRRCESTAECTDVGSIACLLWMSSPIGQFRGISVGKGNPA